MVALFAYQGSGSEIVRALKYADGRRLVAPLADRLAAAAMSRMVEWPGAVTWLPTSARRRRSRGFDQAELLARAVARRLDVPVVRALDRPPGKSLTGLDRAQREQAVHFRPRRDGRRHLSRNLARPGPLLVVDDVCTTGATMRAALAALAACGVEEMVPLVLARTP